jgi:glycosyltransferase involved in cell wall biosynthesis
MASGTVSVIIPFLDPPIGFFREAIASVAAQSCPPVELILVNDGSREAATAVAIETAERAELPVRCIGHEGGANLGSSASRNAGVSAASGEYVAFLDADDVWVPTKLCEQAVFLDRHPQVSLVFGQTRYWYSWQGETAPAADFVVSRGVTREVRFEPPDFVAGFLRGRVIVPSASNTLIRRDAYLGCGGFEERFRGMYEDQAFLVKLGLRGAVAGVPRCWDRYRQHDASMTAHAGRAQTEREARLDFLEWTRGYCREQPMDAPSVREAVNKEIWLLKDGDRLGRFTGRTKRWALRLEEALVPSRLRQRMWDA